MDHILHNETRQYRAGMGTLTEEMIVCTCGYTHQGSITSVARTHSWLLGVPVAITTDDWLGICDDPNQKKKS